jgi:hypothetical protein
VQANIFLFEEEVLDSGFGVDESTLDFGLGNACVCFRVDAETPEQEQKQVNHG